MFTPFHQAQPFSHTLTELDFLASPLLLIVPTWTPPNPVSLHPLDYLLYRHPNFSKGPHPPYCTTTSVIFTFPLPPEAFISTWAHISRSPVSLCYFMHADYQLSEHLLTCWIDSSGSVNTWWVKKWFEWQWIQISFSLLDVVIITRFLNFS